MDLSRLVAYTAEMEKGGQKGEVTSTGVTIGVNGAQQNSANGSGASGDAWARHMAQQQHHSQQQHQQQANGHAQMPTAAYVVSNQPYVQQMPYGGGNGNAMAWQPWHMQQMPMMSPLVPTGYPLNGMSVAGSVTGMTGVHPMPMGVSMMPMMPGMAMSMPGMISQGQGGRMGASAMVSLPMGSQNGQQQSINDGRKRKAENNREKNAKKKRRMSNDHGDDIDGDDGNLDDEELSARHNLTSREESPEEIAAWIEERRKKFPTRARIAEKLSQLGSAANAGAAETPSTPSTPAEAIERGVGGGKRVAQCRQWVKTGRCKRSGCRYAHGENVKPGPRPPPSREPSLLQKLLEDVRMQESCALVQCLQVLIDTVDEEQDCQSCDSDSSEEEDESDSSGQESDTSSNGEDGEEDRDDDQDTSDAGEPKDTKDSSSQERHSDG